MKKPTLERAVPTISARPPRLAMPVDPDSAENSRASILHRTERAIGRRTKRGDGNRDRRSQHNGNRAGQARRHTR
jgi:hypothetical protein